MLDKKLAKIDWENKTALEIKNLIRGLNPIMGAYAILRNKKIKIWKAEVEEGNYEEVENGTIVKVDKKQGIYVKTKQGILHILEVQAENSKRMNVQDYLRGNPINELEKFE